MFPTGLAGIAARLCHGPRIDPTAHVAPSAALIGEVIIEEQASVWYGAVLRGDINRIVIGPRSNVQDGAIVHVADEFPAVVGELVTIGHAAVIHACTLEDEVLIGMGAVVLDGAEIGARSIIGANALVIGGMKIPAGSLVVGTPGKVVRTLSAQEQTETKLWATKYVEVAKRFRAHLAGEE